MHAHTTGTTASDILRGISRSELIVGALASSFETYRGLNSICTESIAGQKTTVVAATASSTRKGNQRHIRGRGPFARMPKTPSERRWTKIR